MADNKERVLLFIPMYNCEKQITRVLGQLTDEIQQYIDEVIIINNRSTDDGENAAIEYFKNGKIKIPAKVLRNDQNYGLGGSHKVAFNYAFENGFDYLIVLHGDDQGDIDNCLPYLKTGEFKQYDCFLGARFMKGAELQGYSKFRTFGNRVFNALFSIATFRSIKDLGSGLNIFKTKIFENRFYALYTDKLLFNDYMVLGYCYYKLNFKFFPIKWREDDQVSNAKMVKMTWTLIKMILGYTFTRKRFMKKDHRDKIIDNYSAQVIFDNQKN